MERDGANPAWDEWGSLFMALRDSATPALAERVGQTVSALGILSQTASEPATQELLRAVLDHQDALKGSLAQLTEWHQDGTWNALQEVAALFTAVKNSATPPMAERLGTLLMQIGLISDKLSDPSALRVIDQLREHEETLMGALSQWAEWQDDGTWTALVELGGMVKALKDSVSPAMVERLVTRAREVGQVLDQLMASGLFGVSLNLSQAIHQALGESAEDSSRVTITGLVRAMKDPGIQRSLKIGRNLLKKLPDILAES